jgi:hypothetical protein
MRRAKSTKPGVTNPVISLVPNLRVASTSWAMPQLMSANALGRTMKKVADSRLPDARADAYEGKPVNKGEQDNYAHE